MNILIIGRQGQLAWELQGSLNELGRVTTVGRPEIDLVDPEPLRQIIRKLRPHVLLNAAAYTAVDQAEVEAQRVMAINAEASRVMAEEAQKSCALFVTYSTDYVFDGLQASPYTELDAPNPLNVYGASKLAGDRAVEAVGGAFLIFRTSWVYGPRGKNFLRTMMKLALEREEIRVVDDQIGAPTAARDIAQATRQIIEQVIGGGRQGESLGTRSGVYNMTSQGSTSWCGFATAIVDEMRRRGMKQGGMARIVPISSEQYPTAAIRPRNSRLSNEKIRRVFGVALPDWKDSLRVAMEEVGISAGPVSVGVSENPSI